MSPAADSRKFPFLEMRTIFPTPGTALPTDTIFPARHDDGGHEPAGVSYRDIPAQKNTPPAGRKENGAAGPPPTASWRSARASRGGKSARFSHQTAPLCRKTARQSHSTARFSHSTAAVQSLNRAVKPLYRTVLSQNDAVQPLYRTVQPLYRRGSVSLPCGYLPLPHG